MCGDAHLIHVDPSRMTVLREPDSEKNDGLRVLFEVELHHHLRYETVRAELVVRDGNGLVAFRDDSSLDLDYAHGDVLPAQARFYVPKLLLDAMSGLQIVVMARVVAACDPIVVAANAVQRRGL